MHDYSYSAHLVINDGYEDRLDMTITCQNAQQLLRAKDLIADQMNAYIAEFAVQSGLTGVPSNAEQNAAALQTVIQEQTEKAKQQEPEELAEPEPPEATPDEPEESPPRTMTHSMPSATAQTSHPSNSYPPKLPKRQRHPQEQKA
nr:MAG TPA: hypothetical protein [Bacteriophage sp.]